MSNLFKNTFLEEKSKLRSYPIDKKDTIFKNKIYQSMVQTCGKNKAKMKLNQTKNLYHMSGI